MKVKHFIKFNRHIRVVGFLSVVLLMLLSAFVTMPLAPHTDYTEAATGTPTDSTLAINITKGIAAVSLTPTTSSGTFATSTSAEQASFGVTTNNYTGYALSISPLFPHQ